MTDEQLAQIGNGITNEELAQIANALIEQYKPEIIRDRDWWHGTDTHSFNIHSPDEDGWFQINVYKVDPVKGMDDYEWWIDLPRVFLGTPQVKCVISMRHDLAKAGYAIPASKTFRDYDTLVDDLFITAKELEGATFGNDPADQDDHPFCYVDLKDGRSLYFVSVDLDFDYLEE
jgi:hypothetical protein